MANRVRWLGVLATTNGLLVFAIEMLTLYFTIEIG
jgi:hypothetical protein